MSRDIKNSLEDLQTDTDWLIGHGIDGQEAKDFIQGLMDRSKPIIFTKSEKTILLGALVLLVNNEADTEDRTDLFYKVSKWCEE